MSYVPSTSAILASEASNLHCLTLTRFPSLTYLKLGAAVARCSVLAQLVRIYLRLGSRPLGLLLGTNSFEEVGRGVIASSFSNMQYLLSISLIKLDSYDIYVYQEGLQL